MKRSLTLFFSLAVFAAFAQKNSVSISKSVDDDGKTLNISVNGNINGRAINYNKSFNVSGLSKTEKEDLKEKVYESIGLNSVSAPDVPQPQVVSMSSGRNAMPAVAAENGRTKTYAVGGKMPYTKELSYDPENGVLVMKYRFKRDGVEHTAERTVDADIDTAEKRERAVKDFEEEICLPGIPKI